MVWMPRIRLSNDARKSLFLGVLENIPYSCLSQPNPDGFIDDGVAWILRRIGDEPLGQ